LRILDAVAGCTSIGIGGHIRPDGDCAGSCLAMGLYLRKLMPDARIDVFLGDMGEALSRNLAGTDLICLDYETDVKEYDAFICMDCEESRLGDARDYFRTAKRRINIDHHISNSDGCGSINYVRPEASSACELAFETMTGSCVFTGPDADGLPEGESCLPQAAGIDEPVARNLYIGMMTDTGIFSYSNTSKKTMEIAGTLMEYGFDFTRLVREIFQEKTYTQQQIMGRALLESVRILDGKCIFCVLNRKTLDFFKATNADLEGIANQLLLTEGVVCSIFLSQISPLTYKISLRSNGEVNVASIAEAFGGGGHTRAAGCTVNAQWHDIVNNMTKYIAIQLEQGVQPE